MKTSKHSATKRKRGFTLIEMLIVMAIIGLIAALVGPSIIGGFGRGQRATAAAQISNIEQALDTYRIDVGRYPESLEGLVENDIGRDSWTGPYLRDDSVPLDPWGNEYHYERDGNDFILLSYGADGEPGGEGDDADID